LSFPATAESVAEARHAIQDYAASLGAADVLGTGVSVSEIVTNAIVHAFRDRVPGTIELRADTLVPDTLRVTVTDDGDGMRPDLVSRGLGLGLPLVGELTTDLEITPNRPRGTRVVMHFSIGSREPAAHSA
jgi:anti-sigma regulatory factor (Ser/Thr protein kinase)